MKNLLVVSLFSFVAALLMQGCLSEEVDYSPNGKPQITTGVISFADMSVEVATDVETINSATRSSLVDTDNYIVEVLNADGSQVMSFEYASRPETPVELEAGLYTVAVMSSEMPDAAWDTPIYESVRTIDLQREGEIEVGKFICKLANVMVSVEYPSELTDVMGDDVKTDITVGSATLSFAKDETRVAYFRIPSDNASAKFVVTGTVGGEPVNIEHQETDLKSGQWRKLAVDFHYVPYKIPVIKWGDNDLNKRYTITEDEMSVKVDIMAGNGIAGLTVDIISDVLTSDILEMVGLSTHLDLVNPGEMEEMLQTLGFQTGSDVKDKQVAGFDISTFMPLIYGFGSGDSDFKVTVTDNEGKSTVVTLMFRVE